MAELPDLTVFAATLNKRFKGKTLANLTVSVAKKLNVSIAEITRALEGKELKEVVREGKTLRFNFTKNQVLGLHLMLRGELELLEKDNPAPRYQILAFQFKDGSGFAVTDMQKMATLTLNPKENIVPDALAIDFESFAGILAKKRAVIKTVLMDQHAIRGIGNSYGDEILWHAKISPLSIANAIPSKEVKQLYKSLHFVLETAIKEISKENGDELGGELRDFMKVHGAHIKTSPTGAKIISEKVGGRKSYYTDEQKLFT